MKRLLTLWTLRFGGDPRNTETNTVRELGFNIYHDSEKCFIALCLLGSEFYHGDVDLPLFSNTISCY